jgi:O-acetyl-ADP-ribose deacetylase (regulator of RNase III)
MGEGEGSMDTITVTIGDMFESDAQTLVNTVNCVGVMGKGIALEFKKRFPDMFEDYVARCKAKQVQLGRPYLYKQLVGAWILNFPTKGHWRAVSKLSDIVQGLKYLEDHYHEWGITSLAVPPLGCGNGQLDWQVVGPTLYRHLKRLDIRVEMYAPVGTPREQLQQTFLEGIEQEDAAQKLPGNGMKVDPAEVALVGIISRITREPYHWPVGRIKFQKMAYFATECGLPTGLAYQRGSYGPFAPSLKRLTTKLVNNGLIIESKQHNMFIMHPGPAYRDARELYKPQLRQWAPTIERVADLFLRLPRTIDAEIAATVHFAAQRVSAEAPSSNEPTELDVLNEVKRWKEKRRPPLDEHQIANTIRSLNVLGWVKLRVSDELHVSDDEAIFVQVGSA